MKLKLFGAVVLTLAVVMFAGSAHATYTIQDVGPLGTSNYGVYGVNNGQVVGQLNNHAVIWSQGTGGAWTTTDLAQTYFSNSTSIAWGINASGQVVGQYGSTNKAFLYIPGTGMIDLGSKNGRIGFGISDNGQVTGQLSTVAHPFVYSGGTNGTMTDIYDPTNKGFRGYSINNNGQVTGSTASLSSNAFFYSEGVMTIIPKLGTGNNSIGYGINNDGIVVGSSNGLAFYYTPSTNTTTQIPTTTCKEGGTCTPAIAYSINKDGLVVGKAGTTHAFIYDKSTNTTSDLFSLVSNSSGWNGLIEARAINDDGWIVGIGSYSTDGGLTFTNHAYLLTPDSSDPPPLPLPPAVFLLAPGLVGLIAMRRRFKR